MQTHTSALIELIRIARKAGAAGVELLQEEWVGHRLQTEKATLIAREDIAGSHLRVRCWLDGGRVGTVEGPLDNAESLIEQALLAAANGEDSDVSGPVGRLSSVIGGLGIDDRRYAALEHDDRLDVLLTAERAARQVDKRVLPGGLWYEDRRTQRTFVNSKGVELEEADTVFRAGGTVSIAGGTWPVRKTTEGRSFSTIASIPFGTLAAQTALDVLPRGVQLEGPVRVLLEPEAVAALIAAIGDGFTLAGLTGDGFFLAQDPEGLPVVDESLHLIDDGTLHGALRTASFDDRGVSPLPLTLIREGRIDGRFLALERSRELDQRPTGHRVAGRLQPRNLLLRSGGRSVNVLLNEADGPVLRLQQLPDLDGFDLRTGDLTALVAATVMRDNKAVGGMSGVTLTGNLGTVLNSIVEVASNTDRVGHVDAPALLVDGFSIG